MDNPHPMNLSEFISELSAVEKQRDQFDVDRCFVPRSANPLGGTVNLYRGVEDTSAPLIPSLYKVCGTSNQKSGQNEQDLIRTFTYQFPELFDAERPKSFRNLARLRHFGVPVRLMDVTTDPLVALYFACHSDDSDNGGMPKEDANKTKTVAPPCAVNLFRFDEGLSHDWTNPYFKEMMDLAFEPQKIPIDLIPNRYPVISHKLKKDITNQAAWDDLSRSRLVLSPYFTKRQAAQRGHFIFFPPIFELVAKDGKTYVEQVPLFGKTPDGIRTAGEYNRQLTTLFKVEIPSTSKPTIREELEKLAGLTQATLFPEDIDSAVKKHLKTFRSAAKTSLSTP